MLPGASPWKQTDLERYVPMPLDESLLLPNKDENNNIQTTFYHKPTDQQAFLHAKSEHPRSLKRSIPYSQALKLKQFALQVQNLIRTALSLNRSF